MNRKNIENFFLNFFKDKNGKVVILQKPNVAITGWIASKIFTNLLEESALKSAGEKLGAAFLFTWAYMEITKGRSNFRRLFGAIIMAFLVAGFFSK